MLFNDYVTMDSYSGTKINFYDASLDTRTDRGTGNTTFDYFPDDFAVGDAIEFVVPSNAWQNLKINVGTAIAATSYAGKWQMRNDWGGTWTDITVVDGTVGFSVTGANEVTFNASSSTFYGKWGQGDYTIRYLITAVDTPTQGGANATDKAKVGTWNITIQNGDTKSLADIYAAYPTALLKGATDANFSQYACPYFITILSGGKLTIKNEDLTLFQTCWTGAGGLLNNAGGTLELGDWNSTYDYPYNIGTIRAARATGTHSNAIGYLGNYGSLVFKGGGIFVSTADMECYFYGTIDFNTMEYMTGDTLFMLPTTLTAFDNITINSIKRGYFTPGTYNKLIIKRLTEYIDLTGANQYTFLDCKLAEKAGGGTFQPPYAGGWCKWVGGIIGDTVTFAYGQATGGFRRMWRVNILAMLNGVASSGITVTCVDKDGNSIFSTTTAADGTITEQWVETWRCWSSGTPAAPQATYTPHTFTFSKAGYVTQSMPITLTADKQFNINLKPALGYAYVN